MASTLKRFKAANITTSITTLTEFGGATGPASGKVWNIPRLYIVNITTSGTPKPIVQHLGGVTVNLIRNKTMAVNDDIILENIVMVFGDSITVISDTVTSLDVFGSIIEEDA